MHFNSRPHGGRQEILRYAEPFRHFNSRPHGGRQKGLLIPVHLSYFNSRPHGGRPIALYAVSDCEEISTHALTEGDIRSRWLGDGEGAYFNSRPHGGRLRYPHVFPCMTGFQLTPSRRATGGSGGDATITKDFNSRPHGGRLFHSFHSSCILYFNSRPHGGRQRTVL